MDKDLRKQALELKSEADQIIRESGILNILSKYGEVKLSGSYVLDVMSRPDLDIIVAAKEFDLKAIGECFADLLQLQYFHEINFIENVHFPSEEHSMSYWFGPLVRINGREWKVDINFMTLEQDKSAELTDKFKRLLEAAPGKRDLILEIKEAMRENKKYIAGVNGKRIYRAVLENNVKSVDEFRLYIENEQKG